MNGIQRALEGMMVLSSQGALASVDHVRQLEGAGVSSFTVKRKESLHRCACVLHEAAHFLFLTLATLLVLSFLILFFVLLLSVDLLCHILLSLL